MAGSSMTFTRKNTSGTPANAIAGTSLMILEAAWTSDDTTGAVSGTYTGLVTGLLLGMETDPGSTAPTDNYDVAVTNDNGLDVLGGNGADRDTANTEFVQPKDSQGIINPMPLVGAAITVAITNAGNSKVGVVRLYIEQR